MRFLPKPIQDPMETFELCISRIRVPEFKQRLEAIGDELCAAANEYDECGNNLHFYKIESHDCVGDVTSEELGGIYTLRMVGKNSPGRKVYDQLRSSAPQDICPFCAQRVVGTLDHYLPKRDFPSLVVAPNNLVPSCRDCNSAKLVYVAEAEEHQLIHPYYDDFSENQWLFAELVDGLPAALNYCVRQTGNISEIEFARLEKSFSVLGLDKLYASHAAAELTNINFQLEEIFVIGGAAEVRLHLQQAYRSRQCAQVNSWQTACYQALCQSNWFCEGGFRETSEQGDA